MPGSWPAEALDTAAQVLALAQQTADQAIADAAREADRIVVEARKAGAIRAQARAEYSFGQVPGHEREC